MRLVLVLALAACHDAALTSDARPGDVFALDDGGDARADAEVIDANLVDAAQYVHAVDCATVTPVASVTTAGFSYSPQATTIMLGEVVTFTMSADHDLEPDAGSDPGLAVDFEQTACLSFQQAGTFSFHCGPHQFHGSVTVN